MRHTIFTTALLLSLAQLTYGQGSAADYADATYQYSENTLNGTARFRGLGGNHAALGGDASNLFGNPAGLGFYNRSEVSISPSFNGVNNRSSYLGAQTTGTQGNVSIGQFSVVFSGRDNGPDNRRVRRSNFGISYSQALNFQNYINAVGSNQNRNSSILQTYVNAANAGDASNPNGYTGQAINNLYDFDLNQAANSAAAAYQLYLIDPTGVVGQNASGQILGPPYARADANTAKVQQATISRSGASSQWTLAYAGNFDDKFYIGGSLGITRLRFNSTYAFTETPINGTAFNNYGQTNTFTVTGTGINATLGIIYKLVPEVQLGATIVSPTFSSVREQFQQNLSASPKDPNIINPPNGPTPPGSVAVVTSNDNFPYSMQTPFRATGGATVFLGKAGFLTATAEYVGYGGMRARTTAFNDVQTNNQFRSDVTREVQATYKSVVNLRAGAEFRAGIARVRAGVGYLPSAYVFDLDRVPRADRSKLLVSAGLGVRNERFFADLSGSYLTYSSGFTPYSLPSDANTPTVLTSNRGTNVTLSVGTFF
jgi:hypothetical protein